MSIIILLLAASLSLGTLFLVLFIRAVRSGQYQDTVTPAMRILADDEPQTSKHWKKERPEIPKIGNHGPTI
jgi:cbb3-type cytochrome oxidase maturation protein